MGENIKICFKEIKALNDCCRATPKVGGGAILPEDISTLRF
jgi:hypothetical protein